MEDQSAWEAATVWVQVDNVKMHESIVSSLVVEAGLCLFETCWNAAFDTTAPWPLTLVLSALFRPTSPMA